VIGHLRGQPLQTEPERLILDVGGVGYEVAIPLSTYYEIQRAPEGQEVALHVHTHMREGVLALFGFWTEGERAIFQKLIQVTGIGPRLAQTVLSGMPPADLAAAISAGDVKRLTTIPGIGKKTAERMVLELREKVGELALAPEAAPSAAPASVEADLVAALVNLGYKATHAERAVAQATAEAGDDAVFANLLRASLKRLSKA